MSCEDCPLRGQNRVEPEGPDDAQILIIGEAPGEVEERLKLPFMGPAGQYLDKGLLGAVIERKYCKLMNLIECRPPMNDLYSDEGKLALKCCMDKLIGNIKKCSNRSVVILLGSKPLNYFGIEGGIHNNRGFVYKILENLPAVPTFHPSYLNRQTHKRGDVNSKCIR